MIEFFIALTCFKHEVTDSMAERYPFACGENQFLTSEFFLPPVNVIKKLSNF